jgi:predicted Fe-Mo cluster-binding NifX family protein
MRIVIPTNGKKGLQEKVAEHFGRCPTYTFLDERGRIIKIIDNTSEHMGGLGLPPELMKKHEANILLCKGLGSRAIDLCNNLKIDVYVVQAETVEEMIDVWNNKKIKKATTEDSCKEH